MGREKKGRMINWNRRNGQVIRPPQAGIGGNHNTALRDMHDDNVSRSDSSTGDSVTDDCGSNSNGGNLFNVNDELWHNWYNIQSNGIYVAIALAFTCDPDLLATCKAGWI